MKRFIVTGNVPHLGKVQHVIRARTADDARERFRRAHPGTVAVEAQRMSA